MSESAPPRPPPSGSFLRWLAGGILFTVPAVPHYLILGMLGFPFGLHATLLVLVVGIAVLPLAFWQRAANLLRGLELLQIGLSWLAVMLVSLYWVQVFPELLFFVLPAALALVPPIRFPAEPLVVAALALTGATVLVAGYEAASGWVALYLAGLAAAWMALRFLPAHRVRLFPGVALVFLAFPTAAHVLSFLIYTGDQIEQKSRVAGQDAVWPVLPDDPGLGPLDDDLGQVTAFLARAGAVLLFPRHRPYAIRIAPGAEHEVAETAGIVTNDIVLDPPRGRFYFVSGRSLYSGSLESLKFEEAARIDSIDLPRAVPPAFLRARPGERVRELLIVFDGHREVVLYDLDRGQDRGLTLPYEISAGDWHPGGDRLLLYGKSPFHGHILVVDLEGRIMRERKMWFVDRVEFARVRPEADGVVAMFFLRGRSERFSADTLETEWAVRLATPRAGVESSSGGCLLVPSYSRGTLSVLDSRDGQLIERLWMGRRVRSITVAPETDAYWISSAAGQFILTNAALPPECRGRRVR